MKHEIDLTHGICALCQQVISNGIKARSGDEKAEMFLRSVLEMAQDDQTAVKLAFGSLHQLQHKVTGRASTERATFLEAFQANPQNAPIVTDAKRYLLRTK